MLEGAGIIEEGSPRVGINGLPLGATVLPEGCAFSVWAPRARTVHVEIHDRRIPLEAEALGYFMGLVEGVVPGDRYWFVLDGSTRRPDPASRAQPGGVHEASAVLEPLPCPPDVPWHPPPLARWVIYELHVGTFTPKGTFAGVIDALPRLVELGVNAVELMPVAAFPGARNWGYDGVCPFAVHEAYGGAPGLLALVDACHRVGIAVVLDVVYNHLGPEGNYLADFGPYFTDRYRTPWGPALNFDGPGSDEVRRYFIDNALMWLGSMGLDALRLDAVHAIVDPTPRPFLAELSERVDALVASDGRPRFLIAESDANDPRLVRSRAQGGLGMHAVWADDFHHALHAQLTGERRGYYGDYDDPWLLVEAITEGFAYRGQYSPFRERQHGAPTVGVSPSAFVVCTQNHDQVGNRIDGARLSTQITPAGERLAAALLLTSPHVPLLWMGQEYGEPHPFAYFTSHGDPALVEAVRRGRREEFAAFHDADPADGEDPQGPPDPQALQTFQGSRLDPTVAERSPHRELLALYRELLRLRRAHAGAFVDQRPRCELYDDDHILVVHLGDRTGDRTGDRPAARGRDHAHLVLVANLDRHERRALLPPLPGRWTCVLDGEDPCFGGGGPVLDELPPAATPIALPGHWFGLLQRSPS